MGKDLKDITAQTFGRLFVIKYLYTNKKHQSIWLCKCECGKEVEVRGTHLRNGHTASCGCLSRDIRQQNFTKHSHALRDKNNKTYESWCALKTRCYNKNAVHYKEYGGRGITVCDTWLDKEHGFEHFLADMGERPLGRTLDRIDNDGNYCKENCRWATSKEQANNRRESINSLLFTFEGKTATLLQWSEIVGINYFTLWNRIKRFKWSIEKTLTTPVRKNRPRKK